MNNSFFLLHTGKAVSPTCARAEHSGWRKAASQYALIVAILHHEHAEHGGLTQEQLRVSQAVTITLEHDLHSPLKWLIPVLLGAPKVSP